LIESFNKVNLWLISIIWIPKTQFIVFNRMRKKIFPDSIEVTGGKLRRLNTVKYLGLLFDSGLRWVEHIRSLKIKVSKYSNIKMADRT